MSSPARTLMPKYEISIPDPTSGGLRMCLQVEADHWMAAVLTCLDELPGSFALEQSVCELQPDHTVHVTDQRTGHLLIVRERAKHGLELPAVRHLERPAAARWYELRTGTSDAPAPRPSTDQVPRPRMGAPRRQMTTGTRRRITAPMLPIADDHPVPEGVLERLGLTPPRTTRLATPPPRPASRHVDGSLDELLDNLRDMDDRRRNAEQLIDRGIGLVWDNIPCHFAQFLLAEHRKGWRVIAARGARSGDLVLTRTTFDSPALSAWSRNAQHAIQVESEDGVTIRYARRNGGDIELTVGLALMVPVRSGLQTLATLLITDVAGAPPWDPRTLAALSELGRRLGSGLALRL